MGGAFDFLREGQIAHGRFGAVTSSIDWCELNFTYTPWIAEIINTLTNVPSILLGLYGCVASYRSGVRIRYCLTYLGLTLIGVGSFGFHATLKWEWQLMDELPMIYVVSHAAYLVLDTLPSYKLRFGIWGPFVVLAWDIFVTVSYISIPNPVYHQVAFAGIMSTAVFRSVYLITRLPPPSQSPLRTNITKTFLTGVLVFIAGFAIWNIDNIFCDKLRAIRANLTALGLEPLGFFIEGHAYWHLMTGYGSFLIFTACIALCLAIKIGPNSVEYDPQAWAPIVCPLPTQRLQSQTAEKTKTDSKMINREEKESENKVDGLREENANGESNGPSGIIQSTQK